MVTYKRTSTPTWHGNGFGKSGCDYAVLVNGQCVGKIEDMGQRTWRLMLAGQHPYLSGTLAEAKAAATKYITHDHPA